MYILNSITAYVKFAIEDELMFDVPKLWCHMAHIVVKIYEKLGMQRVVTIAASAIDEDEDYRLQFIVNILILLKDKLVSFFSNKKY